MKNIFAFLLLFLLSGISVFAQVSINTDNSLPDNSAMLDVKSTSKGMLVPRMTAAQRNAISNPATGLLVFCTDNNQFYSNKGTPGVPNWVMVSSQWLSNGSDIYYNSGNVGIGTSTPNAELQLANTINNRKIVLYDAVNNDHQFNGFGTNAVSLRYQVIANYCSHIFYAGTSTTTSSELMRIQGNGNVGIGTSTPNAPLQLANTTVNRKLVLFDNNNNDHQFYGIGINALTLRYQVDATSSSHVFYAGTSPTTSSELMRIQGNGNVGIGTSTPNNVAILDVSSTTKGLLPPRMTSTQMNAISSPPAGLMVYNTSNNCIETYNGSSWVSNMHYIGESYGGGIVFYVYDNGQHGLIAATADQSTGIRWYGGSNTNTRARADGVGAGLKNTSIIIANQGPVDGNAFAATVCNEYSITVGGVTYGDWYLPSKYELNLLYLQKAVVGGFANNYYWSSSEYVEFNAWFQAFLDGYQGYANKFITLYVRAVRAF